MLEAVAWDRKSFTWTYDPPDEACTSIQHARYVVRKINSAIILAELATVEAEIQSDLGERGKSLNALKDAIPGKEEERKKFCERTRVPLFLAFHCSTETKCSVTSDQRPAYYVKGEYDANRSCPET